MLLECSKSDSTNSSFKVFQDFEAARQRYEDVAEDVADCLFADYAIELYRLVTMIGVSVDFDEDAVIYLNNESGTPYTCVASWNSNGDKDRIDEDGKIYEQKVTSDEDDESEEDE